MLSLNSTTCVYIKRSHLITIDWNIQGATSYLVGNLYTETFTFLMQYMSNLNLDLFVFNKLDIWMKKVSIFL